MQTPHGLVHILTHCSRAQSTAWYTTLEVFLSANWVKWQLNPCDCVYGATQGDTMFWLVQQGDVISPESEHKASGTVSQWDSPCDLCVALWQTVHQQITGAVDQTVNNPIHLTDKTNQCWMTDILTFDKSTPIQHNLQLSHCFTFAVKIIRKPKSCLLVYSLLWRVSSWAQLHPIFSDYSWVIFRIWWDTICGKGTGHGPVKTHTCERRFPLFTVQVQVLHCGFCVPSFWIRCDPCTSPLSVLSLVCSSRPINCKSACQQYSPQSNCVIVYMGAPSESQANNLLEGGSQSMGNPWWRGQSWVKTFLKVCKGVWSHSPVWWDQGWSVWAKVQELHLEKSSSTVHTTSGWCSSSPPLNVIQTKSHLMITGVRLWTSLHETDQNVTWGKYGNQCWEFLVVIDQYCQYFPRCIR